MLKPSKLFKSLFMTVIVIGVCLSCGKSTPELVSSPTMNPTNTNTPIPTDTATPTKTATPTQIPTATRTPRPTATRTPKPTNTPEGPKFGTRDNPYYVGENASLTQDNKRSFEIGLIEVRRGADALDFVKKANQFNDPPPEGMEFIVAKVFVNYHTGGEGFLDIDEQYWSVITKGRIFGYWDKPVRSCCLEPAFDILMFAGGESFGYMAWPVYEDDPNPLLAFGLSSDATKGWFFALELPSDTASQPRPTPIVLTEAGKEPESPELGSLFSPYPVGESAPLVKGGELEFEVSITNILRGADAMNFIKRANQFNDPPPPGFEFVVVKANVYYTGKEAGVLELTEEYWNIVTQGRVFDQTNKPSRPCCLKPPFEISLLSGGEAEGYMAWPIHQDDPNPLLVFGLSSSGDKGWFFSLTE